MITVSRPRAPRSRRFAAALVTLIAASLAVVLPATPAQAATTTLTLTVERCNGCVIIPLRLVSWSNPDSYWQGRAKTVRDGRVSWTIPRAYTRGLYFQVNDPNAVATGGVTYTVARYSGKAAGEAVSASYAASHNSGWHCWYGTTRAARTLHLEVDRFPGKDPYSGETGYWIRPYFNRTLKSFGDRQTFHHGTFGGQEMKACRA